MFLRSGFEPAASSFADQRSPGWANQKAEVNKNLAHCYLIVQILTYPVRVINKHFGQKSTANFAICLLPGMGGDEIWDQETMFSQLAKRSARVVRSGQWIIAVFFPQYLFLDLEAKSKPAEEIRNA